MKFTEALKALKDGKKIRQAQWQKDRWIELGSDDAMLDEDGDEIEITLSFLASFLAAENWEIVPEKQPQPQSAEHPFVIIRSYDAGVFAGNIAERDNSTRVVKLRNAIRLWYWDGAFSLSQLAMEGVSKPANCKFSMPVTEQEIFNVIEIIPVTDIAEKNIKEVKPCKK